MSEDLERFVPEGRPLRRIALEHTVRYRFAEHFAAGGIVLDLGCGDGYGTAMLAAAGAAAYGVDPSGVTIALANERYRASGARFTVGDARAVPFADASFDVVVCFEVIEHLEQPEAALAELRRVLKPSGTALISTPNRRQTTTLSRYHFVEYNPQELRTLLERTFPGVALVPQVSLALSRVAAGDDGDLNDAEYLVAVTGNPPESATEIEARLADSEAQVLSSLRHYMDLADRVDQDRGNIRKRLEDQQKLHEGVEVDRLNLRTELERERALQAGVEADRDNLRAELERITELLHGVEADRDNLRAELHGVEADRGNLRSLVAELDDRLVKAEQRLLECDAKDRRIAELESDLTMVLGSRSWRTLRALGIVKR